MMAARTTSYLAERLRVSEEAVASGAARLDDAIERARAEGLELAIENVVDAILARVGIDVLRSDLDDVLSGLRIAELCLTVACARHDKAALERFEATYGATIDAACRRFKDRIDVDEARQRVRDRLLFSERPGVASYAGEGELAGWVRVSAVRCLINILAREMREEPIEDDTLESLAASEVDPEGACSKGQSKEAFKVAFVEAFEQLTNREKSLLRYAYADGLTVERIGAVYRVHRATAARWVTLAREKLMASLVEGLVDRLDIDAADVPSVLRAALSEIPSTVMRHLRGG